MGFKDQFEAMVAPHVVSPSLLAHDDDHNDVATTEGGNSTRGGAPPGTATGSKKLRAFTHRETRKNIRAADEEAASYVQDVWACQLNRVKIEGERQVEAQRREREAEGQRNRGVKEALQV